MTVISRRRSLTIGLGVATLILLLDQLTKWWAIGFLQDRPPVEVTSFFNLAMVWNFGISFGLFPSRSQLILISISGVITFILLIWLYKNTSRLNSIALGLVIGGAIGNVIDRLVYGAVADFLDFHLGEYHWPAFNIADAGIFIGVVLLCLSSMFMDAKHQAKGSTP